MWGKEPNSEVTEWMGSLRAGPRDPHISRASWESSVLQLGVPPSMAPSQTCFFESSVAPAAPGSVGPQSQHRHTHVSALWWQEPRERDTVWGPNRKQQMGSCQLRNDRKRRDRK